MSPNATYVAFRHRLAREIQKSRLSILVSIATNKALIG